MSLSGAEMKILIFSDIHGDTRALERLLAQPADVYIAAGDLSVFGRGLDRIGAMLAPLGERVWVLPGNHETERDNHDFCKRFGLVDFHRQTRQLGQTNWAGLGYSNPTPFDTPGEYSEEEIAEALAAFDEVPPPLYLVVHFPPRNTALDEVAKGRHAGSQVLRQWVERKHPEYLFCGHIHECAGKSDQLGPTQCFNVGKAGYLLQID
jgi:Icc-related predicted phosphoesterase